MERLFNEVTDGLPRLEHAPAMFVWRGFSMR